ncbi:MAG: 4-hydroxy-tetrahydrodipicolinate reductase [Cyclobacteriaceae bacterium]|nr:4-hydroxy-tetrahydrodipicolinate reductase [Cyclobacteriaceae bacterium]
MNIGLIGYGKMGKEIERLSIARGHRVSGRIDYDNPHELADWSPQQVDVAIEFTAPDRAYDNIKTCIDRGIKVVSGTTGWTHKMDEIQAYCKSQKGTFFYASNFSLGVNITFKVNQFLAKLINRHDDFSVSMEETHHTEKKDAPSGTAITLAEGVLRNIDKLDAWVLGNNTLENQLPIYSKREGMVPGIHAVQYRSAHDRITLSHEALDRTGFALGAVLVAEWIQNHQGVLSMDDFLEL